MEGKSPKLEFVDCKDFSSGLNVLDDPTTLENGESPYLLNVDITKMGGVLTRFGYDLAATIGSATGPMRGLHPYYRSYDDDSTVDQTRDPGLGYANTYTVPAAPISEAASDKSTFTPTKVGVVKIAVYVVAKGTGDWTLTLHDAANTVLGTFKISNINLTNAKLTYFLVPYTWTSGALHFHLTSTVADGTVKVNTAADLSTVSFVETYSTKGDYLILHHSNGNSYYVTNSNSTPVSIGSYGTDNGNVNSVTFNNYAIFTNGYTSNVPKKWNVDALADIGSVNPPPVRKFGRFQNRLLGFKNQWGDSTLYYSDVKDETTLYKNYVAIEEGDGTALTGAIRQNDALQLYKENSVHAMNFSFDTSYNLTLPQIQPVVNAEGGAASGETLQGVYGYSYYLSRKNIESYGPTPYRYLANQPTPISLKLTPFLRTINYSAGDSMSSMYFDEKYFLAVPTNGSTINDTVLVYNESIRRRFNKDSIVMYSGWPVQKFALFRDASKLDQAYFTSNTEPNLYKLNNDFADNGFGYDRIWRSKTFRFGERTRWKYIDLEGAKVNNGKIYVDLYVDGSVVSSIEINDSNFVLSSAGGSTIGYNYVGTGDVGGGGFSSAPAMFAWKKRIQWPDAANYGYEAYFQIRNNAVSQGWALLRYVLCYSRESESPTYSRTN